MITLLLAQMLGDARPGSSHDAGDVLVAERNLQQCPARVLDTEVVTKIEYGNGDAIIKSEL
jgi:hypothetical protein